MQLKEIGSFKTKRAKAFLDLKSNKLYEKVVRRQVNYKNIDEFLYDFRKHSTFTADGKVYINPGFKQTPIEGDIIGVEKEAKEPYVLINGPLCSFKVTFINKGLTTVKKCSNPLSIKGGLPKMFIENHYMDKIFTGSAIFFFIKETAPGEYLYGVSDLFVKTSLVFFEDEGIFYNIKSIEDANIDVTPYLSSLATEKLKEAESILAPLKVKEVKAK